jgi:hypothetical protein
MKKIANLRQIILLVWVASLAFIIGAWCNPWKEENKTSKFWQEIAYEELEQIDKRKYENYGQGNEDFDKLVEIQFEMEGWNFFHQEPFRLIETNDFDLPFIAVRTVTFKNPENKNVLRDFTKIYIFNSDHSLWIPLKSTLKEIDLKKEKITTLRESYIWQGDWEIPFISQEEAKSDFTNEEFIDLFFEEKNLK